jgi:uncharacterized protein YhfF
MKGILFNPQLIPLVLSGKKTMTRRVIKPQPANHQWESLPSHELHWEGFDTSKGLQYKFWHTIKENPFADGIQWFNPRYQPDEIVYVKETWFDWGDGDNRILYKASMSDYDLHMIKECGHTIKWKSPLMMPEWASRCKLRILHVRVERLQEITNDDVHKEGFAPWGDKYLRFADLWDSINKEHPWSSNPWVWVYEFKPIPSSDEA